MKDHPSSPWRSLRLTLESWGARLLFGGLGRLPLACHGPLATALAAVLSRCLPVRRDVLDENLQIAFPDLSPARQQSLIRGIYYHTILFALELARLHQARPEEVIRMVDFNGEGRRHFAAAGIGKGGGGVLIASAHLGNWEWLGAWYALTQGQFGVVYKPMHNPQSEALAQSLRQRFGTRIFSTRERVPRALFAHLRAGGAVAILADQDARRQGRFLPFFGEPASTATGMAALAIRLGVPILPGFCLRTGPGRFRVKTYPPLWPDLAADPEAEELRLTRAYLACVEDAIRQAPDQYFWWHRRWKTRPTTADKTSEPDSIAV